MRTTSFQKGQSFTSTLQEQSGPSGKAARSTTPGPTSSPGLTILGWLLATCEMIVDPETFRDVR
jgi:hypothetical protein